MASETAATYPYEAVALGSSSDSYVHVNLHRLYLRVQVWFLVHLLYCCDKSEIKIQGRLNIQL